MNIANKLQQIIDIKQKIRSAIITKGVDVDKSTPFKDYPDKIKEIVATSKKGIDSIYMQKQVVAVKPKKVESNSLIPQLIEITNIIEEV